MSLKFYFAPNTTAMTTSSVLDELEHGQSSPLAERIEMSTSAGDTRTAEYLKINPNGKVPAIVHDGIPIWESAAITIYLAELYGEARGLYPASGPKRGEAMKWIVWTNVTFASAASRMFAGNEGSEKGKEDVERCLAILNEALEGREFLLQDGYSLADTHLSVLPRYLKARSFGLDGYPNVKAWEERVAERPALKAK